MAPQISMIWGDRQFSGVLPIAFGVNLEFLAREVTVGAPSTQWWINLSTAIVFGLGFATILTLIVTPAALMAIANLSESRTRWVAYLNRSMAMPTKNHLGVISAGIAAWSGRTIRSWVTSCRE